MTIEFIFKLRIYHQPGSDCVDRIDPLLPSFETIHFYLVISFDLLYEHCTYRETEPIHYLVRDICVPMN